MPPAPLQDPIVHGDLSLFSLYEVLQLLAQVQAEVCVDVYGAADVWSGRIWLDATQVIAAEADGVPPGEAAFYHLFSIERGRFVAGHGIAAQNLVGQQELGDLYNLLIDVAHLRAEELEQEPPEVRRAGPYLVFGPGEVAS